MEVLGIVLFLLGIAFFVFGLAALGKGSLKDAGVIFTLVGVITAILCIYLISQPELRVPGGLAIFFALVWLVVGWNCLREHGLIPTGNMAIFGAIWVALYSITFWTRGAIVFGLATILWIWALVAVALLVYGKIPIKVVGWTFLIEAFITLLYPAWCLVAGLQIP